MSNVEKEEPPFNLQEKIAQVANAISQNEENQSSELPNPKIQRVPKHLRERDVELHPYSLLAAASTTHDGGGAIFSHHNLHDLPKHQNKVATRYYTPKMISIGPIHHKLKLGEKHKLRWTAKYVSKSKKLFEGMALNTQQLYEKIRNNIGGLKEFFEEEVIDGYGDDDLSWMLFVDGCSLLYFMEHYDEKDPEANLGIKYDQLIYMSRDLILLENQLPYRVLELLSTAGRTEENRLLDIMGTYVNAIIYKRKYFNPNTSKQEGGQTHTKTSKQEGGQTQSTPGREGPHTALTVQPPKPRKPPIHLLDFVRTTILGIVGQKENPGEENEQPQREQDRGQENRLLHFVRKYILCSQTDAGNGQGRLLQFVQKYILCRPLTDAEPTYKNIRDLKAANIGVKRADEGHGISYKSRFFILGYLLIPKIRVDDTTAVIVLNIIAFEMCPDFRNGYEVSSFIAFLKSIIDDAEDVRLLRKEGIIDNVLGSDEEVAELFNSFSSDLVVEDMKYFDVKRQIEFHYSHRVRTWIAEFLYNHFSSPWTLAAFSAAVIALALSGIQTYFAAFPADKNDKRSPICKRK